MRTFTIPRIGTGGRSLEDGYRPAHVMDISGINWSAVDGGVKGYYLVTVTGDDRQISELAQRKGVQELTAQFEKRPLEQGEKQQVADVLAIVDARVAAKIESASHTLKGDELKQLLVRELQAQSAQDAEAARIKRAGVDGAVKKAMGRG